MKLKRTDIKVLQSILKTNGGGKEFGYGFVRCVEHYGNIVGDKTYNESWRVNGINFNHEPSDEEIDAAYGITLKTIDIQLDTIIQTIQSWLDFQEAEHAKEGLTVNDDTHIYSVPVWPSRGMFREWIKTLQYVSVQIK